jgi:hypothetical protein
MVKVTLQQELEEKVRNRLFFDNTVNFIPGTNHTRQLRAVADASKEMTNSAKYESGRIASYHIFETCILSQSFTVSSWCPPSSTWKVEIKIQMDVKIQ